MATFKILLTITIFSLLLVTISAFNVTEILDTDPNFSEFNKYLTVTKLADDINSNPTITVLALTNSAISNVTSNISMASIKNILSIHILLDYYDSSKLHAISGQAICTNLYQRTGKAEDHIGETNITSLKGDVVAFSSGQPGSKPNSKFVKEIRTVAYNISVLQISAPIIVPTLLTSGPIDTNVTKVLYNSGCKIFADMLINSGVEKSYQDQIDSGNGITVFAPTDNAFKAKGLPDLSKLNKADVVALLQFHALNSYMPKGTLKSAKDVLKTLVPTAGKYGLTASSSGDTIFLHTGIVDSRVADTLSDSSPVVIFSVDSVLLPEAIFGKKSSAPSPAPTPMPGISPEPATAPPYASPPAPPTPETVPGPADGGGDEEGGEAPKSDDPDSKSRAARVNASLIVLVVVSVVCGVILF